VSAQPFFEREFLGTPEAMSDVLDSAVEALVAHDWAPGDKRFCARLCLEEALVNAITHGNQNDPSRKVRLEMSEEEDTCFIDVYDEGEGFNPSMVRTPDCQVLGGRGVTLMKYYMDRVTYDKQRGCLEMVLRRKWSAGGCRRGDAE
jgi:serine/threonine-protein kinase RsbW